jgi:hypothetical protein
VAVCLLALLGTLMNVAAIDDYVIQVNADRERSIFLSMMTFVKYDELDS